MPAYPPVPDGYIHRAAVLDRGWTSLLIDGILFPDQIKIEVPAAYQRTGGVSNKAYPLARVESAERDHDQVRAHLARLEAAKGSIARRASGYTREETIAWTALKDRGWTVATRNRLRGDPDVYAETGSGQGVSYRYALERVTQAELSDPKLQTRLAKVTADKAAAAQVREQAREEAFTAQALAGKVLYRKNEHDSWILQGAGLTPGQSVTVSLASGATKDRIVGSILRDLGNGVVLASDAGPADRPAGPPTDRQPAQPARSTTGRHILPGRRWAPTIGQPMNLEGRWILVTAVSTVTIDEDMPSIWGSHLLGHEGERAHQITYRPATPEEIPLSDQLALTGWIGEHPRTRQDVAHLFLYPATGLDQDSPDKMRLLGHRLGLRPADAGQPPRVPGITVLIHDRILDLPGQRLPLPTSPEWITAVRIQGWAVLTLTTQPLSAPDLSVIDEHIAQADPGVLWYGRVKVAQ